MGVTTALNAQNTPWSYKENNFQKFLMNSMKRKKIGKTSWNSITSPKPEYTETPFNSSKNAQKLGKFGSAVRFFVATSSSPHVRINIWLLIS